MNEPGATKPPIHQVPDYLLEIAEVMGIGAGKHGAYDWLDGNYPITEFLDAAVRHALAMQRGEDIDPESGKPHAAHAASNLMMAGVLLREGRCVDNRHQQSSSRATAAGSRRVALSDGRTAAKTFGVIRRLCK